MDSEKRGEWIDRQQNLASERLRDHIACLEQLESNFGFDLDIATEVYGPDMLNYSDGSTLLAHKWNQLFNAVEQNPGKTLLFMQPYEVIPPGCYGFGATPVPQRHTKITLVNGASLDKIKYVTDVLDVKTGVLHPKISLDGVGFCEIYTDAFASVEGLNWQTGEITLAQPEIYNGRWLISTNLDRFSRGIMAGDEGSLRIKAITEAADMWALGADVDSRDSSTEVCLLRLADLF